MIAKPRQDFPKSAEGVLHTSPIQGEFPIVPTLEECVAYAIAPPTNRVHHPQLPMASHIGPCEYASPAPMRHHNPSPCPCDPWYPIFGPHEYASPTPMRYPSPFPLFP